MTDINFASIENKATGLWNRPGGKIKTLLLVGLLGFVAFKLLPVFTKALDNTTEFAWGITHATLAIGVAISSVIFVYSCFTSKKLRAVINGIWDILMDKTVGLVIPWNPKV